MKLEKITYTVAKKATTLFKDFYLTRLDVTFSEKDQYITFRLK